MKFFAREVAGEAEEAVIFNVSLTTDLAQSLLKTLERNPSATNIDVN